jgi:Ca-activated chloride channel family protein
MTFIWPPMLYSLLLVPLLAAIYLYRQRKRQRLAERYNSLGFAAAFAAQNAGMRRHIPIFLFLAAIAILLLSLGRPQAVVHLPRVEGTIILGFDVSGSMIAEDYPPTRMEAAKAVARDFVLSQPPTVRIGVVAFSNNGFAVQPPTYDQEQILEAIARLTPQQGTSLGQGIVSAINTLDSSYGQASVPTEESETVVDPRQLPAAIVLLSDGENNAEPNPFEAAMIAADRGIKVYTIGIGSTAGSVIELNGFNVHTRLDERTLQQIAAISGGEYFYAETGSDLQDIYNSLTPQLIVRPEEMEMTSLFAAASIVVMLIAGFLSLLWFNRLP